MSFEEDSPYESEADMPLGEPAGQMTVEMAVPVPTLAQVAGEMARQILAQGGYDSRPDQQLRKLAEAKLLALVEQKVAQRAESVIDDLLNKPMQRTDGYGHPVGDPQSLSAVLAGEIEAWAGELVTTDGKPKGPNNSYGSTYMSRLEFELRRCASHELKKAVDSEVVKITAQLKAGATQAIAKQIADRVAGLVLPK